MNSHCPHRLQPEFSGRILICLAFLSLFIAENASAASKRILFFAGPASHGWGAHQHPAGSVILSESLRKAGLDVVVELTYEWPDIERLRKADAFVIYADGWWSHPTTNHLEDLKTFMDDGGGLTVIH